MQSPSECTEDTDGGRSPEDRPGAGDLALRLLGLAAIFGFPPPPAKRSARSSPGPRGGGRGNRAAMDFWGVGAGGKECMHPALPQHHARFESLQLRVVAREGRGSTCRYVASYREPVATRVPQPRACSPSLWSLVSSYSKISQILKGLRAKRACAGYVSPAKQEEAPEGGQMDGLCVPPHRPWAASAGRREARVEEAAGFMQWPEKLFCSKPGSACSELARMVTRGPVALPWHHAGWRPPPAPPCP